MKRHLRSLMALHDREHDREARWHRRLTSGAPLAVFMSYDPRTLIAGGLRFVHPERRDGARRLIGVLEERLRGWMVGAGLAMLFVGTGAGVAVLLSFLFLGRLLGAVGLLLAVPALVFLTTVADELLPRDAPAEERSAAPADKSYDSIPS